MKRRCNFLDILPAFNYNTGFAEVVNNEKGVKVATDTRCLGSTIMKTILSEVGYFYDHSKVHQQVSILQYFLSPPFSILSLSLFFFKFPSYST